MRIFFLYGATLFLLYSCGPSSNNSADTVEETSPAEVAVVAEETGDNTLTDQEQQDGWTLLFDGQSTNNWRGVHKDAFPEQGWKIEDGQLAVLSSDGAESQNGGDIVTENEYDNFEFQVDLS